jgi:endonuclease III
MPPKRRKRTAAARESPRKKAKLEIPDKYVKQQAGEFLEGLEIPTKKPPSESSVLHLLIASLILSARMSENISTKSFILVKNEYPDLQSLSKASWNELCDVISKSNLLS